MATEIAWDIGVLPNPSHQCAQERARDARRLDFLQKLQDLVESRQIRSFKELMRAKKEVEETLGYKDSLVDVVKENKENVEEEAKMEKEENEPEEEPEEEPVAKKPKKEKRKKVRVLEEPFPRLVRRNARRGSVVADGQTWTEEVIMG